MKNIFKISILIIAFSGCNKESLDDCDEKSPAFKPVKTSFSVNKQNQTISFVNNTQNGESYFWEFGDGTTSKNQHPDPKTYPISDKPYVIKLTAQRCNGVIEATYSQAIDMKCLANKPTINTNKNSLCKGESTTITSSGCANGSVLWNNGATSLSISVSTSGTYSAQCKDVSNCLSPKSESVQIVVNPKPAAPIVTALLNKICEGEKVTITATGCNGGVVKWSDGNTGNRIDPIITGNASFKAICIQNGCESVNSNTVNITMNPLALVFTEKATVSNNKSNWVLNGKIDFKTILNDGIVADHGFIFASGNVDPQTINAIRVELKEKIESKGTTFFYEIPDSKGKLFSYRGFVKLCNGEIIYGNLLKTK